MASPQLEDGYTSFANELIEALMRTNLAAYQSRVLMTVLRLTYGWHKKEDFISNKRIVELTGLKKSHVSRTISELVARNMVTKAGNKIGFNKDYQGWRELPIRVTVTNRGNKVTDWGNRSLPIGVTTKRVKTIQTGADEGLKKRKKLYKRNTAPGFQPVLEFYLSKAEEAKGFKPELPKKDFDALSKTLKKHGEDRVRNIILFFLDSEKSDQHVSLAAALSADTINQYHLKWQKVRFQYGDDADIPTGEEVWWK